MHNFRLHSAQNPVIQAKISNGGLPKYLESVMHKFRIEQRRLGGGHRSDSYWMQAARN